MKYLKIAVSCIIFLSFITSNANSTEFKIGGSVVIGKNDTINDDIISASKELKLKGFINGDVISAGGLLVSTGNVEKDFIGAGRNISVGGIIGDDIITASEFLTINGDVKGDVIAVGKEIETSKEGVIDGNIYSAGGTIIIGGHIKGSVNCRGSNIIVSGVIDKNAKLAAGEITFLTGARILGDLVYQTKEEIPNLEEKGFVKGNVSFKKIVEKGYFSGIKLIYSIWSFAASLVVGFLMLLLLKKSIIGTILIVKNRIMLSFGVGLLTLIGVPILIVVSMILVITIPLGLILTVFYFIIAYVTKIYIGILLGLILLKRQLDVEESYYLPFILGLIIISILTNLPYIDNVISTIINILGMGGITIYFYSLYKGTA